MKSVILGLLLTASVACLNAWGDTQLTKADVQRIIAQAASRARQVDGSAIIAVVDREGYVLGVWDEQGNPNPTNLTQIFEIAGAISRAGTAAFLSSNQNAFTSRTAGYIIQQHFPPLVRNTTPGPLVGVGISSVYLLPTGIAGHSNVNFMKQIPMGLPPDTFDPNGWVFADINPFSPSAVFPALTNRQSPGIFGAGIMTMRSGTKTAAGMGAIGTSLNDAPGGVPLYKSGELVGGVGVTGHGAPINISTGAAIIESGINAPPTQFINAGVHKITTQQDGTPGFTQGPTADEDVALAGQIGYAPPSSILATNVYLGGIQVPYVQSTTNLGQVLPLGSVGAGLRAYPIQKSPPPFKYPHAEFGGVSGEIRFPIRSDPGQGQIDGSNRLSAGEVADIIANAAKRVAITRAAIRLPLGIHMEAFISVVGNPGLSGSVPPILGVFRTGEATIFSWDVAVQKARTAFFFSSATLAQSSRTVGFLAERYFPPGIDGNPPGPYFGVQEALLIDAFLNSFGLLLNPSMPAQFPANPYLTNEITIFPGGFPLYRKGVLIGAIGVSGDGVDQDDIVAASGCDNFLAPSNITADNFLYQGARLPYAKFPRDPSP